MRRKNLFQNFSRRDFLKASLLSAGAAASAAALTRRPTAAGRAHLSSEHASALGDVNASSNGHAGHGEGNANVGEVDTTAFDPMRYLYEFNYGRTSTLPNGQTLREWDVVAVEGGWRLLLLRQKPAKAV